MVLGLQPVPRNVPSPLSLMLATAVPVAILSLTLTVILFAAAFVLATDLRASLIGIVVVIAASLVACALVAATLRIVTLRTTIAVFITSAGASVGVAAVVALYPPTDLRGWVTNPPEEIKKHDSLKPPLNFDPKKEPEVSPVLHVSAKTAPTLLIHGDKDKLVPIEHSHQMMTALEKEKVASKLVVIEGAAHGFTPKQNVEIVMPAILDWFEKHLTEKKER